MKIVNERIALDTSGNGDFKDITGEVARLLASSGLQIGHVLVFVVGSTAGITTLEYEPALVSDMREFHERMAPARKHYYHDDTWGDANGFSHVRASFTGSSLAVPFEGGRLLVGTWQQIVLAEFDNRPRRREIIVQIIGE